MQGLENEFEKVKNKVLSMPPIKTTLKLKVGEHIFHIDGTDNANIITNDDKTSVSTVSMDEKTFLALRSGKISPFDALGTGKMSIKGSYGVAFKYRSLLNKD